jgi:hypothetical protein
MLRLKVGSYWVSSIGAYGPVSIGHVWPGGLDTVSWEMAPGTNHPALRGSALVTVYDAGVQIGVASLVEPGTDGMFEATGLHRQAASGPCLTTGAAFTTIPNDAVDGAIARGEVQFTRPTSISTVAWAPAAENGQFDLKQLLDGYAAEAGLRWYIDNRGALMTAVDPTTAVWHVPQAVFGRGLTPAEDDFYTHLIGRYIFTTPVAHSVQTVGSAEAATAFRRRTKEVDLTSLGVITGNRALDVLNGMFLKVGARMGWAEGLELSVGQVLTVGGTVETNLSKVEAGDMIRLRGTVDVSKPNRAPGFTDIVIASSKYTEGSGRISLTPIGYAPRNLGDLLTLAAEGPGSAIE